MPKHDRTGDTIEEDEDLALVQQVARCDGDCDHGWRHALFDSDGQFIGRDRNAPDLVDVTVAKEVVYPCATHRPEQWQRWDSGCWAANTYGGHHNPRKCDLCIEDGRR